MAYDKILYLQDAYLKEFEANVKSVKDGKFVVLDQTAFYPRAGGQDNDTGKLMTEDGREFPVIFVGKSNGEISHEIDFGDEVLKQGEKVRGIIDWDRRYKLMRSHTAAHVISGLIADELGAKIHGNKKTTEKISIDFDLEEFDKDYLQELIKKSNIIIAKGNAVKTYFISREELDSNPGMMKLAKGLPENVKEIRIVEIVGFDKQPCGGTHVKALSEIGEIEFLKADNKGKTHRRLYCRLKD